MDFVCPSWSGIQIANINIENLNNQGFLSPCPKKTALLRKKYINLAAGRTIVGLSWSSGGQKRTHKNPPLSCWAPLLREEEYYFVSTQYSGSKSDLVELNKLSAADIYQDSTVDLTDDIDDAAAQLAALDIVVTVSNTTAHLAGALGVTVGTVIPSGHGGFWYWFRTRSDSPWYSSMQIFRQTTSGEWLPAIANISNWIKNSSSTSSHLL
jgi:ADP-heptose:LPS heptosyltransferase